ncbi:hypothetical protein AX17_003780 [Amanita inopinata Kibby_2008]|nr:hypothetical protein AX17_003780 [Amanita inopinata Kibby_2008]
MNGSNPVRSGASLFHATLASPSGLPRCHPTYWEVLWNSRRGQIPSGYEESQQIEATAMDCAQVHGGRNDWDNGLYRLCLYRSAVCPIHQTEVQQERPWNCAISCVCYTLFLDALELCEGKFSSGSCLIKSDVNGEQVVFTSPGYAKDHVHTMPQPIFSRPAPASTFADPPKGTGAGHAGVGQCQERMSETRASHKTEPSVSTTAGTRLSRTESVGGPSYEDILLRTSNERMSAATNYPQSHSRGAVNPLPPPATSPTPARHKLRKLFRPHDSSISMPRVYIARRPPTTAALLPENRYCTRDCIVKPHRAHHCRNCGTCVLKYDHHCPWIGQCVGARNHKFFLNFTQAVAIFTTYVLATLLAYTIHDTAVLNDDVDPQRIVIIALAGLFALFNWTLTVSHILLITKSQTTVESMVIHRMKEQEVDALARAFSCWDIRGRRRTRKEWDREWGDLDTEGNIWWMGSRRKAWEDVMGSNIWGWLLPIGRGLSDGLSYPVNSRFDADGRWRRRSEWPAELQ